jgi:Flp pilus assembly protein TadG
MPLIRFLHDRAAGVAPLLGICALPLVGAMGAAIDYSRAASVRTSMQMALDSAALMLSKDAQGLDSTTLSNKATAYFNALFHRSEVTNVQISQEFGSPQLGSFSLKITGTTTMPTIFWRVIGTDHVDISATGEVLWGMKKLNLALALDNTGSMSQNNKMTELKKAAHTLLTTLQNAAQTPGDVMVSIIPFATDVNVGTGNVGAAWLNWSGDETHGSWNENNGSCSKSISSPKHLSKCTSAGGVWTPASHNTWNGCVMDRDQNNDILATTTGSSASTKYYTHQATACPTPMMPLSDDWTALNSKVDAMTPTGNTNVTIGIQLAWQSLSPVAPFSAPAPEPDLDKVIIALTDGTNTQNRWSSTQSVIDDRTSKVCTNAKADNIKIYTIRVIDGNQSLLQGCATNPGMYYEVSQASQLNGVFTAIAQNLANLRIAK